MHLSLSPPPRQDEDRHARQIYSFSFRQRCDLPSLSLFRSRAMDESSFSLSLSASPCHTRSIFVIEIGQSFDRQTSSRDGRHTCFCSLMVAYVSVMMIIYQERSIVVVVVVVVVVVLVSVIRLHQTLFFSRIVINSFTETEPGERTKRLIEVVLCDGSCVYMRCFLLAILLESFLAIVKRKKEFSFSFSLVTIDFSSSFRDEIHWCTPFSRDLPSRTNYFVNEKRATTHSLFSTHSLSKEKNRRVSFL